MKSPLLIFFIVFNLLAVNLVMANNMYEGGSNDSHQHSSANKVVHDTPVSSCIDEHSCNHICHISAHMVGYISQITLFTANDESVAISIENDQLYSLTLDPLLEPPKSLI